MKLGSSIILLAVVVATIVGATSSAVTMANASNHKSSSDPSSTGSGSKGSDISESSSQGSSNTGPGSDSTQSSSGNPPGSQTSGPNPPGFPPSTPIQQQQPLPTCPNGEKPDSSGKCPAASSNATPKGHTKDFGQGFSAGSEDGKSGVYDPAAACAGASNQAHCMQGYKDAYVATCIKGKFGCGDGPTKCTPGEKCILSSSSPPPQPCKGNGTCPPPPPPPPICKKGEVLINGKCVSLGSCRLIDNGTKFECPEGGGHTTIIERNTIQQLPVITSTSDINLFLVTTCTADQNNGVLNGNLAALCDSTITMMHNDGLGAQLPQVDLYLKARGLLS